MVVMEVSRPGFVSVSRPDFMGLGLVFQRWRSRLGLEVKGLSLAQNYSIETTRPEGGKIKTEAWKKHSIGGRFQFPSEKMMFLV